jgi:hypothetical protein
MTQATVEVLVSNLVVSEVEVDRVAVSVEETLTTSVIEVGVVGPQGPAGAADLNYTHVQALPSDVWVGTTLGVVTWVVCGALSDLRSSLPV